MANRRPAASGQLRIIGGRWRGRKLRFKAAEGLRPTADRVRETLFNWLAGEVQEARCLDLFAGSGALGLEALSRGAESCCFVDNHGPALDAIRRHLADLDCERGDCLRADALDWLAKGTSGTAFDIVFLDPPFNRELLTASCQGLEQGRWLSEEARIYVEYGVHEPEPAAPENWELYRDKRAGDVCYRLFVRRPHFV